MSGFSRARNIKSESSWLSLLAKFVTSWCPAAKTDSCALTKRLINNRTRAEFRSVWCCRWKKIADASSSSRFYSINIYTRSWTWLCGEFFHLCIFDIRSYIFADFKSPATRIARARFHRKKVYIAMHLQRQTGFPLFVWLILSRLLAPSVAFYLPLALPYIHTQTHATCVLRSVLYTSVYVYIRFSLFSSPSSRSGVRVVADQ